MKGFVKFIREQGVIGLAVGFVLGAAVAKVVAALVEDIINPIVGLLLGKTEGLRAASFHIATAEVKYGDFLSVLIDFAIVAAVVYFVVHGLRLDKLDAKKDEKKKS